jgi:3-hydroxybutyryl-CoA dehydrogenase
MASPMNVLATSDVIAVIGAGAMGAGIAQVAAQAGHRVFIFDASDGAAERGRDSILSALARQVEKGRMASGERDLISQRLVVAHSIDDLSEARLVIEAIVESLAVKRQLFASLEGVIRDDTILATNTSSLSVTAIAAGLRHPERVAGFHFFNPAPVMKLVEIVSGLQTAPAALEALRDTAIRWGKEPVFAKSTPGFIVNRVARPFYAEALRLHEENAADIATIDAVMRECGGFRMGPFELMDLIGHDVNLAVTRSVFDACFGDPRYRPSLVQQELVAAGWLGRKTGRGFYLYGADAPITTDVQPAGDMIRSHVEVQGDLGPAEGLVDVMIQAGLQVERCPGKGLIRIAGATLALSDGRMASDRIAEGAPDDLILFDLALDYGSTKRIALAKSGQTSERAIASACGFFQALGKRVSLVDDVPGLIVMRTVAMIANEAAEAMRHGVATGPDIDRAMTLGVNYPRGPLEWAEALGFDIILTVLDNLQAAYGDDRYRASLLLRRKGTAMRITRRLASQTAGKVTASTA